MSTTGNASSFSPRAMLSLVLVGLLAFAGMAVLAVYAPQMRGGFEPRAHALSSSAIGFRGAVTFLKALKIPASISRVPPAEAWRKQDLLVLTPELQTRPADLAEFYGARLLIVMPKWSAAPDPDRPGFVHKVGAAEAASHASALLNRYSAETTVARRKGRSSPRLRAAGAAFAGVQDLRLSRIDRLQTIGGSGWEPLIVDDRGGIVLAKSSTQNDVYLLADPDVLNTQGLAQRDNARTAAVIVNTLRRGKPVAFDVTLSGHGGGGRSLLGLMLRPPWLAATLCGVAAALLMGLHGLARFGPTARAGRDLALGRAALVDNSAGLIRLARREHEFAPAYFDLTAEMIARGAGGDAGEDAALRVARMARLRGAEPPEALRAEAGAAKTRHDLIAIGRKLYNWRLEITRERH